MIGRAFSAVMLLAIKGYQLTLSRLIPAGICRFTPTCSHYAVEAIRIHGPWRGLWLAAYRLSRCNPLCKGGYDPPPEREKRM